MDRMLYVAMTGAQQALVAMASGSHNLANVSTTGFRADLSQFRAMPAFGEGYPSRVYAMNERPGIDFAPGAVQMTGRDLDVAVKGEGFIAVQAPDGGEAYTRAGDLRVSSAGLVETGAGHPVLGNGGPIALPPADKIEIGSDGTISFRPLGGDARALAVIDRIRLVNPPLEALVKDENGLLRLGDGATAEPDAAVKLASGALETSNVNAVDALVDMIALARRFETQVRLMRVAEDNDAAAAELLRIT